jgi:cyclopropane fatty-acyl-phospholipid synthase-like methyltransferase
MEALALKDLPEVFDAVIDSRLFHVFSDEDRKRYVEGLASVLKPGGRLFLLCFSDEEPGTQGSRRVNPNCDEGHSPARHRPGAQSARWQERLAY